jgi:hypothetical protein
VFVFLEQGGGATVGGEYDSRANDD